MTLMGRLCFQWLRAERSLRGDKLLGKGRFGTVVLPALTPDTHTA